MKNIVLKWLEKEIQLLPVINMFGSLVFIFAFCEFKYWQVYSLTYINKKQNTCQNKAVLISKTVVFIILLHCPDGPRSEYM